MFFVSHSNNIIIIIIGSWRNCKYKVESMLATGLRYFSMFGIDVLFIIIIIVCHFHFLFIPKIKYHYQKCVVHVTEIKLNFNASQSIMLF